MCSKHVRYFPRGRNNKSIDSIQFLGYNLTRWLVFYLQHILKNFELIFCYFCFVLRVLLLLFFVFPHCVWEEGMIKETGQGFVVSCCQLPLESGRGVMIGMSNKNRKLCLTFLVGFSDLFEFLLICAVQLPLLPFPKSYCLSSCYQDGTFVITRCNLMCDRNSRTFQNRFLFWNRMFFLL